MPALLSDDLEKSLAAPNRTTATPLHRPALLIDEPGCTETPSFVHQAEALVARQRDSAAAQSRLAIAHLTAGNRVSAIKFATQAIALICQTPNSDAASLIASANVLVACGELEKAETAYTKASTIGGSSELVAVPYAYIAALRGEYGLALARLGHSSDFAAEALRGRMLLETGDTRNAIAALRRAARIDERSAEIHTNLGYGLLLEGAGAKALRATQVAHSLAPANRTAGLNLASMLGRNGLFDQASTVIDELLTYHPDDIRLHFAAAQLTATSGRDRKALSELHALKFKIKDADPIIREELTVNIALVRMRLGEITRTSALDIAFKGLQRCSFQSEAIVRVLPALCSRPEHVATAVAARQELAKTRQSQDLLRLDMAIAAAQHDWPGALECSRKWFDREPLDPSAAMSYLCFSSVLQLDIDSSLAAGKRALTSAPRNVELANNLAFAAVMARQLPLARSVLAQFHGHQLTRATAAALLIAEGDISGGTAGYRAAAESETDPERRLLTNLYARFVIAHFTGTHYEVGDVPERFVREYSVALVTDATTRALTSAGITSQLR
jgi:tetratricopeptide (TPR) repeat protein